MTDSRSFSKKLWLIIWVIFVLWFPLMCGELHAAKKENNSTVYPGRLLITGSSAMCPLIGEIGSNFRLLHPELQVEVQCGGSGRGIKDVREGVADIGMVSYALTEKEKDLYGFPMARDGVSIIVHTANPVNSLSDIQVVDIFTGTIVNWKDVGGLDAPITVINSEKNHSSSEPFTHYFHIDYASIKASTAISGNQKRIRAVADNPCSISYTSSGEAEREAGAGASIKSLPFNEMMPTNRNIITGNYPVTRPITLVTRDLPSGPVKTFVDYCLSSAVVETIERYEFVPYED